MQKLHIKISSCSHLVKRFCTELLMLDEFNLDMRNWANCRFGLNSSILYIPPEAEARLSCKFGAVSRKTIMRLCIVDLSSNSGIVQVKTTIIDMASQPKRASSPLPIAIRLLPASEFSCSLFFLKRLIILIVSRIKIVELRKSTTASLLLE